jgi:hypothetical protein
MSKDVLHNIIEEIDHGIDLYDKVAERITDRHKLIKILNDLCEVIIETRMFIEQIGYVPNINLSNKWRSILKDLLNTKLYNEPITKEIFNKSRFWGDPQKWLKEPGSMELVPTLTRLEAHCEMILRNLRN